MEPLTLADIRMRLKLPPEEDPDITPVMHYAHGCCRFKANDTEFPTAQAREAYVHLLVELKGRQLPEGRIRFFRPGRSE